MGGDPRQTPTQQSWTLSQSRRKQIGGQARIYILTSYSTVSAAEQFSYDLKMPKRVTARRRNDPRKRTCRRFSSHQGSLRNGNSRDKGHQSLAKTDWEAVGVDPDVPVNAAQALETAEKPAESKLQRSRRNRIQNRSSSGFISSLSHQQQRPL